jgi:hypothetical protein
MLDMGAWERREFDVLAELKLDPKNVRLGLAIDPGQSKLLEYLYDREEVLDLIKGIATMGFLTQELPVVVLRNREYVVVEGNRRLSALKLIQNPWLIDGKQSVIERAIRDIADRNQLRRIEALIAPSEADAGELVAFLHTTSPRKSWTRVQQTAFFRNALQNGDTLEELLARFPRIKVRDFVRLARMLELFESVEYENESTRRFITKIEFPLTILERIYDNVMFREVMGISIDATDVSVHVSSREVFDVLARKIVADIESGVENTRTLTANWPSFPDYLNKLRALKQQILGGGAAEDTPDLQSAAGAPESNSNRGPEDSGAPETAQADPETEQKPVEPVTPATAPTTSAGGTPNRPPRRPREPAFLDFAGLTPLPSPFDPLRVIFIEMQRINYAEFPNATFDLLRSFLEKSIKAYAHQRGEQIPKLPGGRGTFIYLKDALAWMKTHAEQHHRPLVQVISQILARTTVNSLYFISDDHMNGINHNYDLIVTEHDVRDTWVKLKPLFAYIYK